MVTTLEPHRLAGIGLAPGTCGELAQGVLPNGDRFHVTCPIDLGVRVRVTLRPAERAVIRGVPATAWKTRRALELAVEHLALGPVDLEVARSTELTAGKGMASSTADILAAIRAVAAAAGARIDDATAARLAASIEATDGIMYPGVATVDQRSGGLLRQWSWWPAFTIAMFVPRATRETALTTFPGQERLAPEYAALLAALDRAAHDRDPATFAEQATRSAELNEAFVPNALLPTLRAHEPSAGAMGVCVGHSGTMAGLLFGPGDGASAQAALTDLLPALPAGTTGQVVRMPAPPLTA